MDFKEAVKTKINRILLPESKVQDAQNLYLGQGLGEVRKNLEKSLVRRLIYTGIIGILVFLAMVIKDKSIKSETLELMRNPMNMGSSSVGLTLSLGDRTMDYELLVGSRVPGDEEINLIQSKVEKALDTIILGANPDLNHVSRRLEFPTELVFSADKLLLSWSSDRMDLVDTKGNINNRTLEKDTGVTIRAKVRYGEEFRIYERLITIIPPILSDEERLIEEALREIVKTEEERDLENFVLPEEINGVKVALSRKKVNYPLVGMVFVVLIPVIGYFAFFEQIAEKRKQKVRQGLIEYKDFVRKLTLLLAAGMSVRLAWKKLCSDQYGAEKDSLLAEALLVSLRELDSGIREQVCYRRFGQRMGSRPYERLAEILSQQTQKGVNHVSRVLEAELRDVEEAEKEEVKVRAEKAGTALLVPIMGLLSIVFLVIMVPAFSGISL